MDFLVIVGSIVAIFEGTKMVCLLVSFTGETKESFCPPPRTCSILSNLLSHNVQSVYFSQDVDHSNVSSTLSRHNVLFFYLAPFTCIFIKIHTFFI